MIKLILNFWSGTRLELVFNDLTDYTNHLILSGMPSEDFSHFEVVDTKVCAEHTWRYIPLDERAYGPENFRCHDCEARVLVGHLAIDELYRDSVRS